MKLNGKAKTGFFVVVLMSASFAMLEAMPVAHAYPLSGAHYDWAGFNGNNTIYLSTGIAPDTTWYGGFGYTPPPVYSSFGVNGTGSALDYNALAIGVGGNGTFNSNNDLPYSEFYVGNPTSGSLEIRLPVTTVGYSNFSYTTQSLGNIYQNGTQAASIAMNISGSMGYMPYASGSIDNYYNSGVNVTGSYLMGTKMSDVLNATIKYFLGVMPGDLGVVTSSASYYMGLNHEQKVDKTLNATFPSLTFGVVNSTLNKERKEP